MGGWHAMSRDELLFLSELIKVEPDKWKKNILFEEILNALVEMQSVLRVGEQVRCETLRRSANQMPERWERVSAL
jgi:uncharacterized protein YmfQ (DUF2313 family)